MSDLFPHLPFSGSNTALLTPFSQDGALDEGAFEKLVDWQITQGTHGLVPVGTTGESPTLSHEEHERVVELCVKTTAGRVPVIAGAGSTVQKRPCVCRFMQKLLARMQSSLSHLTTISQHKMDLRRISQP